MEMKLCPICKRTSEPKFRKRVLGKYVVQYFRCGSCDLLFTESPYWSSEAYDHARMGLRDTGMVERNLRIARVIGRFIVRVLDPSARFLDYGAGTGLLVRMMRDWGFDFHYLDPYASNIFARGLEAQVGQRTEGSYGLVTAIEVIEHSPDPVAEFERMLSYSDTVLFTTEIQPSDEAALKDWNYLHSESGQHVSLFSGNSLRTMARLLGLLPCLPTGRCPRILKAAGDRLHGR